MFSWKFSSGQMEYSFDKAIKTFLPKVQKFFAQIPKKIEKKILENFFSSKRSSVQKKSSFDNPAETFLPKGPKIFRS